MTINELRSAFLSPADEFTPIPFWFWNDEVTEEELTRQIDDFRAHGVAGFVIHPRKGLSEKIGYMTPRWLALVKHAVEAAAARGMSVMLYDEGMYPSGAAHGEVVRENPEWAAMGLCCESGHGNPDWVQAGMHPISPREGVYCVPEGVNKRLFREVPTGGTIRGLFPGEDDGEPDAPAAADLLNPEAVQAFIRLTHEKYYAAMPEHFGSTIKAIFTDEPDLRGRNARPDVLPWTRGFLAEIGGMANLPALFGGDEPEAKAVRERYRQAIRARLLRSYYEPLAAWCEAHGVALNGHPAKGADVGLLAPFHIPGQDVVWRQVYPGNDLTGTESVAAKAAADHARHTAKRRCAVEYLGCCGPEVSPWAMTPADLKWYTDFLLSRGVNLLIPHAFYYSIRGERKDERPPAVGPNNTWWPFFGDFAAYMRRMCFLLTDSTDQAAAAVLCTGDTVPWQCCIPLYQRQAGFCYLEADLLEKCRIEGGALRIGSQRYTHVIVDESVRLTAAQLRILGDFARLGGTVIAGSDAETRIGDIPGMDVRPRRTGLRASHIVRNGVHFYLFFNLEDACVCSNVYLSEAGNAQWWDAWTGEIRPARRNQDSAFTLQLARYESIVLCIDPATPQEPIPVPENPWAEERPVFAWPVRTDEWTLTRADGATARLTPVDMVHLPGWETIPGWEHYAGTVTYETDFRPMSGGYVDLGEVHEIARVWVDGEYAGCRMWPPYIFPVPIDRSSVRLRVEVTGTPANAMDGLTLPSGLLGPAYGRK